MPDLPLRLFLRRENLAKRSYDVGVIDLVPWELWSGFRYEENWGYRSFVLGLPENGQTEAQRVSGGALLKETE
jgi:hypothetical protein